MSGELLSELENALAHVLRKHPEIEPFVDMVYKRPWIEFAGSWRKQTADGTVVLTLDVTAPSVSITFLHKYVD